jgi:putative transcriptional regulator
LVLIFKGIGEFPQQAENRFRVTKALLAQDLRLVRSRHFLFTLKAPCAIIAIEFFDGLKTTLKVRRRGKMAVSYNRLFKLMIDRKMRKKDLCELAGVSTSTMSKMGRDEIVSLEVIDRICQKLNCKVEDVLEILPDSPDGGTSKNVE